MLRRVLRWIEGKLAEREHQRYVREAEAAEAKADAGTLTDADLVYAAHSRCVCGAGMAYPKGIGAHGFWDCSDILTGRAIPHGEPGAKQHEARLPFVFYELKSERQPSVGGATTRRKA